MRWPPGSGQQMGMEWPKAVSRATGTDVITVPMR